MKNHHSARKEAIKMMTQDEIKNHVPPFASVAWKKQKKETADRVKAEVETQRKIKESKKE